MLLLNKQNNILHGTNSNNTPHYCMNSDFFQVKFCPLKLVKANTTSPPFEPSAESSISHSTNHSEKAYILGRVTEMEIDRR